MSLKRKVGYLLSSDKDNLTLIFTVTTQVNELNIIRQSLYDLEAQHTKIRTQYEDELQRLRSELHQSHANATGKPSVSAHSPLDAPPHVGSTMMSQSSSGYYRERDWERDRDRERDRERDRTLERDRERERERDQRERDRERDRDRDRLIDTRDAKRLKRQGPFFFCCVWIIRLIQSTNGKTIPHIFSLLICRHIQLPLAILGLNRFRPFRVAIHIRMTTQMALETLLGEPSFPTLPHELMDQLSDQFRNWTRTSVIFIRLDHPHTSK